MTSLCVCGHFDFAHQMGIDGRGTCQSCAYVHLKIGNTVIACAKFEPQVPVMPNLQ